MFVGRSLGRRVALAALLALVAACGPSRRRAPPPPDASSGPVESEDGLIGRGRFVPTVVSRSAVELALGSSWSCARWFDGSVRCWGRDPAQKRAHPRPVVMAGLDDAVELVASAGDTCVRHRVGGVSCIGEWLGALAPAPVDTADAGDALPVTVLTDEFWGTEPLESDDLALGTLAGCVLRYNRAFSCWGEARDPRMDRRAPGPQPRGNPDSRAPLLPNLRTGLEPMRQVALGSGHACALRGDGTVWCWGRDEHGQASGAAAKGALADSVNEPVHVDLPAAVAQIAAAGDRSCALAIDGVAYCWGDGDDGGLGAGSELARACSSGRDRCAPVAVSGLKDVSLLALGAAHACAVTRAGTVWCWGRAGSGALGDGTTRSHDTPVAVNGIANAMAVVVSPDKEGAHSCALRASGVVSCWGSNDQGQLGDGTTTASSEPVSVTW